MNKNSSQTKPEGIRVALDCANGSSSATAQELFTRLGAEVLMLHAEPDGTNINKDCGSTHMDDLMEFVVANKCDIGVSDEIRQELEDYCRANEVELIYISAASNENVKQLLRSIWKKLQTLPPMKEYETEFIQEEEAPKDFSFEVTKEDEVYYVTGAWLEKLIGNVNFTDYESLSFFQKMLRDKGVIKALEDAGINEGDTVDIEGYQFVFIF